MEYFSVMFNILLSMIYLCTDGLSLIGWHIPKNGDVAARIFVTLKLLLWSFVFLNLLPFKFLIPTLYGRKFFIWINSFFLLWYGSCIWNSVSIFFFWKWIKNSFFNRKLTVQWKRPSNNKNNFKYFQPILQYFYHQIYHTNSNSNDCVGEKSVSRYAYFSLNSLYDIVNCSLFKIFPLNF